MIIPISKEMIEPVFTSNISYVNSIEEFEKIELKPNSTFLAFDNFKQCFYIKSRDKFGEYSQVKILFYEDFAQKIENIKKAEFIDKCQKAGLSEFKIECACKFFLENQTPQDVWLWALSEKKKDIEWDSVKIMKHRLKSKLFPEMVKHKQKVNN